MGLKTINVVRSRPVDEMKALTDYLTRLGSDLVVTEDSIRSAATSQEIAKLGVPQLALNCVSGKSATNLTRVLGYVLI